MPPLEFEGLPFLRNIWRYHACSDQGRWNKGGPQHDDYNNVNINKYLYHSALVHPCTFLPPSHVPVNPLSMKLARRLLQARESLTLVGSAISPAVLASERENGPSIGCWAGAAAGVVLLTSSLSLADSTKRPHRTPIDPNNTPSAAHHDHQYEKRMRENSSLEKVFEYFAQHEKDGVRHMTATDMLAALVCTYPASQSLQDRAGSLDGEPAPAPGASASPLPASATSSRAGQSIFESFDVDGDGVLSFPEFQLILTLMAIPQHNISTIFKVVDLDGSGSIDAQEFEVIMNQLMGVMQVTPADKHAFGRMQRLDTKGGPSGLLLKFFGPELQGKLSLGQLTQFLKQLHDDLVSLEFGHYDVAGTGTIPGLDLARSLAASADLSHTDGLLLKVERLPARLQQAEVSLQEFRTLAELRDNLHELQVALDFLGLVGRPVDLAALDKLVTRVAGLQLSSQVLDITLAVFGDEHGLLDAELLLDTLRNKNLVWRRKGGPAAPSLLQYLMPQW
ncbi:hypothetical protein V8C86DRAFT_286671 [Haematococcus lacustris]